MCNKLRQQPQRSFIMALFSSRKLLDFDTVALSLLFEN